MRSVTTDPWREAIEQLAQWHSVGDRSALDLAALFLSRGLPDLLAPRLARKLGDETVRDLVQQFLLDLHRKDLPTTPDHPKTYLGRALQNRALSHLRHKAPEPMAVVPEPPAEHSMPSQERQVAARQVLRALQTLSMEDRVALKLSDAPEALDADEIDWLAKRANVSRADVRTLAARAENASERVRLFESSLASVDERKGGRAIDRFHKRVSRARQRLLALVGGER